MGKTIHFEDLQPIEPSEEASPRKGIATHLVEIVVATDEMELWHDPDGKGYVTVPVGAHRENWPARSRRFKQWLGGEYFARTERVPNSAALEDALTTIEGMALHRGKQYRVFVRVAHGPGTMYLDLGDEVWDVIAITAKGWDALDRVPPVKFVRTHAMRALPFPAQGGSLELLRPFVNAGTEDQFILMVAWLVGCFWLSGPYPILEVDGEQGSAKSTTCRVLRRLMDPNRADLRCPPRDERDLIIAASGTHVIGLDNLTRLPEWLSDALCRLSTGGGFGTRKLFTDLDEVVFEGQRPVIINGINAVVTHSDLLDRTIRVTLPQIPESKRQPEDQFWREFAGASPKILGALLDAVAEGLRNHRTVVLERKPRMLDFARWVVATEGTLPWKRGEFLRVYIANRDDANVDVLESSPVGQAVQTLLEGTSHWKGTATELLGELTNRPGSQQRDVNGWPKTPSVLAGQLRRLAPNLRAVGIEVVLGETEGRGKSKRRIIQIRQASQFAVPIVPSDPSSAVEPAGANQTGLGGDGPVGATDRQIDPSPRIPGLGSSPGDDGACGDGSLWQLSGGDGGHPKAQSIDAAGAAPDSGRKTHGPRI